MKCRVGLDVANKIKLDHDQSANSLFPASACSIIIKLQHTFTYCLSSFVIVA